MMRSMRWTLCRATVIAICWFPLLFSASSESFSKAGDVDGEFCSINTKNPTSSCSGEGDGKLIDRTRLKYNQ
jgi:hypothetical protein